MIGLYDLITVLGDLLRLKATEFWQRLPEYQGLIRESNQPLKWTRIEWFPANTIERLRLQSIKYVSNIREAGREQGQTCSD